MKKTKIPPHSGQFKPGNKAAAGNPGPHRGRPITQAIIAKLHEVDQTTSKENIYLLVDELFEQAISRDVKIGTGAKARTIRVKGDMRAIQEIIDRAEGKAVQAHAVEGGGKMVFMFESGDEKL